MKCEFEIYNYLEIEFIFIFKCDFHHLGCYTITIISNKKICDANNYNIKLLYFSFKIYLHMVMKAEFHVRNTSLIA